VGLPVHMIREVLWDSKRKRAWASILLYERRRFWSRPVPEFIDLRFRENKPKALVFSHWKRAFWACFRENWVYNFGHRCCLSVYQIHRLLKLLDQPKTIFSYNFYRYIQTHRVSMKYFPLFLHWLSIRQKHFPLDWVKAETSFQPWLSIR
jgi:hypothetical protein